MSMTTHDYADLLKQRWGYLENTERAIADVALDAWLRVKELEARLNNSSSGAQSAQAYKVTIKYEHTNGRVTVGGPYKTKKEAWDAVIVLETALDFVLKDTERDYYKIAVEEAS